MCNFFITLIEFEFSSLKIILTSPRVIVAMVHYEPHLNVTMVHHEP